MDVIKLASIYFFGTEDFNSSNCIIVTVTFKKKIDQERVYPSYRALVMENRLLQAKMVEQPEKNTFQWNRFTKEELKTLLDFEEEQLSKYFTEEEVLERYDSTNSRLVFHLLPVNENTIVFSMHHGVTNGRGLIFWIKKWLEYYSREINTVPEETDISSGLRERIFRTGRRISAYLWLPVFLTGFAINAYGKNETLDLSYDKKPKKDRGYVKKSYSFSAEKTREILRQCRRHDMTFGEYLCYRMTDGLLEHDCGKQRVLVSMPMDIQPLHPYSPQTMHGNYVASLPAQFFREGDLRKQVKEAFKWFKRGVPYGLLRFAAVFTHSYEKFKRSCLDSCKKTMSQKAPIMNASITFSNLGIISYPIMERWVESLYMSVRAQSLFLSSATISGRLMMELCVSKNLYDPEEVFSLFDRILSEKYLLN